MSDTKPLPYFHCPKCGKDSWNKMDVRYGWCNVCGMETRTDDPEPWIRDDGVRTQYNNDWLMHKYEWAPRLWPNVPYEGLRQLAAARRRQREADRNVARKVVNRG